MILFWSDGFFLKENYSYEPSADFLECCKSACQSFCYCLRIKKWCLTMMGIQKDI